MEQLDTNWYYALGIPFYALFILLERRLGGVYRFGDTLGNFNAGLGAVLVGIFFGPIFLWMYDFGYTHMRLVTWPEGSWVPWVVAFFAADFCYWMTHRAGHTIAIFFAIHGVHHQTEEFNISVATRHGWLADTYAFVFYIPMVVIGITSVQFFFAISVISFYALLVHSRNFKRPSFFIFVTPQSHIVHHSWNPRYIGRNLGAMFTLWDRLLGTHAEVDPAEPPKMGSRNGYRTHDPVYSQWIGVKDIIDMAKRAPRLRDKVLVFFKYPGWVPPGVTPPAPQRPARPDAEIPDRTKRYTAFATFVTICFGVVILWFRTRHPMWMLVSSVALILWTTSTIGGLLDGRKNARQHELLRLVFSLGLAVAIYTVYPTLAIVFAGVWAASIVWLRSAELLAARR